MFIKGEIVYHDNIIFPDGIEDSKKCRPCIVLFELVLEGNLYCVTCPITSKVNKFNRFPENLMLIPDVVYSYRKLSFAKTNQFLLKPISQTHKTGKFVRKDFADKLIEKLKESKIEEYDFLRKYLMENRKTTKQSKVKTRKMKIWLDKEYKN